MKVYISGSISSDLLNAPRKFEKAERRIKKMFGAEVINPMKLPHVEGAEWEDYMAVDIEYLETCDTILMLPCWTTSQGARLEHAIAKRKGLNIIYQAS
jgi:hypothetical protein